MSLFEKNSSKDEVSPIGDSAHYEIAPEKAHVPIREYTPEETKRILRKIDWVVVPWLAWLYLLSYLDRGNIGNAKVAGMTKDLKMKGLDYNIAVTAFFPPYALLAIPCNIILKMTRASVWMTVILFCWGLVMMLNGFVQSYHGLIVARFFLGVTESGFFPGASYLLTLFYKRYEVLTRMALFYTCSALAGSFSGLLAFAIQKMDGVGGLEGWRWIFILEGLLPIMTSFVLWRFLPDGPQSARFLTQEERDFVAWRLTGDTGTGKGKVTNDDKLQFSHVLASLKEWKTSATVIVAWGNSICVYGFTYTVPSVILGLGYSAANAQLLTVPIYFLAAIFIVIWAVLSDRYHVRSWFIMAGFSAGALGMLALLVIPHPSFPGLTYGFLFLAASGMYAPFQIIMSWIANNIAPSSKRAVALAQILTLANLGGIAGSNIFLDRQAPRYRLGYGFCLAILVAAVLMTYFLRFQFIRLNKQRDLMTEEEIRAKYTEADLLELGDKSPYYRYTL